MKMVLVGKSWKIDDQVKYLESALTKFQKEVYPNESTSVDVDLFIDYHHLIYLVEDDEGEFCGFTAFSYNNYYGMKSPTVGNTFMFVEKSHRRTHAMHLMSIQSGRVCEDMDIPLEHYIVDGSASENFVGRLNATKLYTTYEIETAEVVGEANRLSAKINLKGN